MFTQKKLLIVEDNLINREMLKVILEEKYQILEAENGEEALKVLKEHHKEISLILLDIIMPVMNGYTFLDIVKSDPAYQSIPVIMTTQCDNEKDEVAALSHGAADFVVKPYKPEIILHRVASIIHLRETAAMVNQIQFDGLTGIYSKHYFYQSVREAISYNPDQEYDIICSDVDNFKLINDVFGVAAGDRLLCEIAGLCKELVGDDGICGRLDADQFACLLEHGKDYTDERFNRLEAKVNSLPNAKNVSMKWGIYCIEDRNVSVEQMCDRALWAARNIKGQYGKHVAFYDDKLRGKLLHQQAIVDNMESALKEGQFLVYLQPKYRIRDDKLAGAEALVRWNHPEWGFQSPAEFIPLFEKNGFITQLDRFVWDKTCALLKEWDQKGYPSIPVSVNVSRADIYNADISNILMEIVEKYGLLPSRLHLEITESAYTENPDQIIETVNHLRKLGFVIEMDDFGSGYSSLNMLNQMPIDILKLDMKFIQSETAKPMNHGVLQFIIDLARWMHLSVVAEGVETKDQLERLMEAGCDYVQGYYFARPMPEDEFAELLQREVTVSAEALIGSTWETGSLQKPVLLVIDEDHHYKAQIWKEFSEHYSMIDAKETEAAISCLEQQKDRIEAVLLSLNHPDGLKLLSRLKKDKDSWDIPVIATGPFDEHLEELAFAGGASDYAARPHAQSSLWKRVRHAVRLAAFKKREQVLQAGAYQDSMTGVLNRRGLKAATEMLRRDESPYAICFFDMDNLKTINDTYGHRMGDRLIMEFGKILRTHRREGDIAARFGGDEFLLIMKQMHSEDAAKEICDKICRAYTERCSNGEWRFTVSVGLIFWNVTEPVGEAIERADQALRESRAGRRRRQE